MSQNEIRVGIVRANAGKNWAKVSLVRPSNVSPQSERGHDAIHALLFGRSPHLTRAESS